MKPFMLKPINIFFLFSIFFFFACGNNSEKTSATETKSNGDTSVFSTPANPYADIDISPMDMSYFPVDYPKLKMTDSIHTAPVMRLIYSRPHKQGRKIFGSLLKYGVPWRLGANEATEIEFFQKVTIQDKKISPGRYVLYCIPYEDKWTIVLNNNISTWGLKMDSTKDLFRFDIPLKKTPADFEYFTMVFQRTNSGAELVMAWENT